MISSRFGSLSVLLVFTTTLSKPLFISVTDINAVEAYLIAKGAKTHKEKVDDVVSILWVEDSEGNHFAFEQWANRT